MLKYFRGAPMKIYLHENLTHKYFHTQKFWIYGTPLIEGEFLFDQLVSHLEA